jgi:hypothetical protein
MGTLGTQTSIYRVSNGSDHWMLDPSHWPGDSGRARPRSPSCLGERVGGVNKTSLPCSSKVHEVRGVYPREVPAAVRRVGA